MNILQAIVLGFIQGLTEFLPISSSGHLIIIPRIFNWTDQGLVFDVLLHLATLCAVLFVFWKDWLRILKGLWFFKDASYTKERHLFLLIIIGILPAVLVGVLTEDLIASSFRLPLVVGINLIFWGIILGIADILLKKKKILIKEEKNISKKKAFFIGIFQAIALIPGGSRSGLSITGGMFSGLHRKIAVKFSFLMSVPLILGAGIFEASSLINQLTQPNFNWIFLIVGFLTALISGLMAIKLLMYLAQRNNFLVFVFYRIILGILILIFLV
jgi:undecaprenyl-diphosphatase